MGEGSIVRTPARYLPLSLAILTGVIVVLGLGASAVGLCQRRAEDARVRAGAEVACVDRLHDETECRRLIEAGHEDCAVFTRRWPHRYEHVRSSLDPNAYLECILLTPNGWVEKKGRERQGQMEPRP
jgi:hypothetical protein